MPLLDRLKAQLDRRSLRFLLTAAANQLAIMARHGVRRIFYDDGIWIHETSHGYFAYHQPYIRLNLMGLDTWARTVSTSPSRAISSSTSGLEREKRC